MSVCFHIPNAVVAGVIGALDSLGLYCVWRGLYCVWRVLVRRPSAGSEDPK